MCSIQKCQVPANTLLDKYAANGAYTDCYSTEVTRQVTFTEFIFAFYTTPLFKLERLILKWTVSKPSTDALVSQLADGEIETFAAWHVESRNSNEILMCDFGGRTRSWLMAAPVDTADGARTRLYFGSAVVPALNLKTGKESIGLVFQSLLGFHKIYSTLLLYSAKSVIQRQAWRIR